MPGEESTSLREPLDLALGEQLRRIELAVLRVWQVLTLVGALGALVVAVVISRPLGLWTALTAGVLFAWFTLAAYSLERGAAGPGVALCSILVESSLPWITLLLLVRVQGAAYALGSWLPPMLFSALIVAAVARLRPLTPLLVGLSSSVAFLALYFWVARGELPAAIASQPLFSVGTQITRATSLSFAGVLAMLLARGLRRAIGRADSDVRAQDLFGKYRVTRQIAAGGMGTVHEALYCPEGGFERRVAIKRIHPHLAEQPEFVDAFRREAELSARLVHPNIVQVFDFGRVEQTYFLAMEYVDGLTLLAFMRRSTLAGHQLSPATVAHIGQEVLAGLVHSHEGARGGDGAALRIIHRDMSPANVLLSRTGEVKISDFGLARALYDAESARTKHVAGHVGYMAPEAVLGQPLDPRCDLFGLGVILWELLAGRRLFARDNESATLFAVVSEPIPPITSARSDIDLAWTGFFERVLAREVDQRLATAGEMARALEQIQVPSGRRGSDDLALQVQTALKLPERRATLESEAPTQIDSGARAV